MNWWECKLQEVREASFKAGQQAGRQDVVDFLNTCPNSEEYEAKLKEWGIKE